MSQRNDSSRSLDAFHQDSTLVAVVEMSRSSWLVAGIVPGLARQPVEKLDASAEALGVLLRRWQDEAAAASGRAITRLAVAFEAYVSHPTSIAVSREHRRAKTDRLDAKRLRRAFLGWRRGEPGHCRMAAIPTLEEEDARRPSREREKLIGERPRIVNRLKGNLARLGIRGFKPTLRGAPERPAELRTPKGAPLPPNALAELRRDTARRRLVRDPIGQIEAARAPRNCSRHAQDDATPWSNL